MGKRIYIFLAAIAFFSQFLLSATITLNPGDNIQNAVDNAESEDTILLNPGIYQGAGCSNITISDKSLTFTTPDPQSTTEQTIIDADGVSSARIFLITHDNPIVTQEDPNSMSITIEGLTLINANKHALLFQGIYENANPNINLRYCNISNCGNNSQVGTGGLVFKDVSTVTITGCGIESNNTGGWAAGIYADNCSLLRVIKSVIRNNTCHKNASDGGGVFIENTKTEMESCFIYGNSVEGKGGGIYINNTNLDTLEFSLHNCAISGNSANLGGGIFSVDTQNTSITNCVFYGNKNSGLACDKTSGSVSVKLTNSILWANQESQIHSPYVTTNASYCFVQDGYEQGTHIFTDDPDFASVGSWQNDTWQDPFDTSNNPWSLNFTSPCIDSGDPNYLPPSEETTDIQGDNRFIGFAVDPGIDEYLDTNTGKVLNSTKNKWYQTINDAIYLASSGDSLLITPGLYKESITLSSDIAGISLSGFKPLNDDFRKKTIIDASDLSGPAILIMDSAITTSTAITGLTIKGGTGLDDSLLAATAGGGIYCKNASPTISYCRIEDNNADQGGGIALINASPDIIGCIIKNNSCQTNGSGIAVLSSSSPKIYNCAINENQTEIYEHTNSGGLYFDDTSYPQDNIIRNCLFHDNMPHGLYYDNIADMEVNSSIFWANGDPNIPEQLIATNDNITLNYCNIEGSWEGDGIENIEIENAGSIINDYEVNSQLENIINSGDLDYETGSDEIDIAGNSRKLLCRIDIGPYEKNSPSGSYQSLKSVALIGSNVYCTLQEAIDAVKSNENISVTKGTFNENIIINKSGVTITGAISTNITIDDIVIDGSYKTIPDITDVDDPNDPNYQGAALTLAYGKASNTTIHNLTLKGGVGSLTTDGKLNGGGICSQNNNNLLIGNCNIENNFADNGGGIYITNSDSAIIYDCKITNNTITDSHGGGVYLQDSEKVLLRNNIIDSNISTLNGGGVSIDNCDEGYIANCQLTNNQSENGGAIYTSNTKTSFDFSTIADNTANNGGAIYTNQPLENSTITNCIIHNNSSPYIVNYGNDNILSAKYSCITENYSGDHILNSDPQFIDPADNNYQIHAYSPCVNMGYPSPKEYPFTYDDDKNYFSFTLQNDSDKRTISIFNPNYDIGAYEVINVIESLKNNITPVALYEVDGEPQSLIGNFKTISDALEQAPPFSTIELEPGIYNEQIRIGLPGITIRSKKTPQNLAMTHTIIRAYSVTIAEDEDDDDQVSPIATGPAILLEPYMASDITLEGLTIVNGKGGKFSSDPNQPTSGGGGICSIDNSNLTLKWCNISSNSAGVGGSIALIRCDNTTIEHCLMHTNIASRKRGGAIFMKDCTTLNMNYCTISNNTANTDGNEHDTDYSQTGGMYLEGTYSDINLNNSIIWGNSPNNFNKFGVEDDEITIANCLIPNAAGTNLVETDPFFANKAGFDFHLRSPAGRYRTWYRDWYKDSNDNINKSPAVDTANGTPEEIAQELFPAGANTNIGIYGGSPEASLSYNQITSDIEIADLNGDYAVDYNDLIILSENWLSSDCFIDADRDNNCILNMADLIQVAANWQASDDFKRANINDDETINFSDFAILTQNWYNTDPYNKADRNKDGIVDMTDLQIVLSQWLENE